jgi:hypothetical protein
MFMILLGKYRVATVLTALSLTALSAPVKDPAKLSLREDVELVPLESIHAAAMAAG